jgi:transcriptional regulator with XRE-family HTH domain
VRCLGSAREARQLEQLVVVAAREDDDALAIEPRDAEPLAVRRAVDDLAEALTGVGGRDPRFGGSGALIDLGVPLGHAFLGFRNFRRRWILGVRVYTRKPMSIALTPKDLAKTTSQIGKLLREARDSADLSRAAAAAKIGVDPQTIFRWETTGVVERVELGSILRAEAAYGVALVPAIRKHLGIDVDDLRASQSVRDQTTTEYGAKDLSSRAVRMRIHAHVAELTDGDEQAEERAMRIVDRAAEAFSAGGRSQPADDAALARIIASVGAEVIRDLESSASSRGPTRRPK